LNHSRSFWWKLAAFVVLLTGFNLGLDLFAILGSGVFPVTLSVLAGISFTLACLSALVLLLVPKRRAQVAVFLAILSMPANLVIFSGMVSQAYESAREYGAGLAPLIQEFRQQRGRWPEYLDELPHEKLRALKPKRQLPLLLYSRDGLTWNIIGGIIVSYSCGPGDTKPQLYVGRRDLSSRWDWEGMRWDDIH